MIEAFIHLQLPEKLLVEDAEKDFDQDLLDEYKSMRREDLDYFKASMILLDAPYFTDEAFLYFFPMLLKQIFDNDGLLRPLINRLEKLDFDKLNPDQIDTIEDMLKTLKQIEENTSDKESNELITIL
jgi:hypothetical protein